MPSTAFAGLSVDVLFFDYEIRGGESRLLVAYPFGLGENPQPTTLCQLVSIITYPFGLGEAVQNSTMDVVPQ